MDKKGEDERTECSWGCRTTKQGLPSVSFHILVPFVSSQMRMKRQNDGKKLKITHSSHRYTTFLRFELFEILFIYTSSKTATL